MDLIHINKDKCIKRGLCVKECPELILRIGENGPESICSENCISYR